MDSNAKFFGSMNRGPVNFTNFNNTINTGGNNGKSNSGNKKYFIVVALILVLAAACFGVWYFFVPNSKGEVKIVSPFAKLLTGNTKPNEAVVEDPLSGIWYPVSKATWSGERPIGVMVNNHEVARPQAGLNDADLVYEIVAEGGITRFLAFFLGNEPTKVGPVRSTREYYLEVVKEVGDAMIMHIGYSPQALEAIENWPVRSLSRLGLNCDNVLPDPTDTSCWRNATRVNANVPWEHTAYANISQLRTVGIEAGWGGSSPNFRPWKFRDDRNVYSGKPQATQISIDFWERGDYSATFRYNSDTNTYLRFTGFDGNNNPLPHIDSETNKQIEATNVVVQFATETAVVGDEKGRLMYQFTGSGEAFVFMDGKVIEATWSKASRDGRTVFYDTSGQEIQFNRGRTWISIVPDRNKTQVTYQ